MLINSIFSEAIGNLWFSDDSRGIKVNKSAQLRLILELKFDNNP